MPKHRLQVKALALMDVLGFSAIVTKNFANALRFYREVLEEVRRLKFDHRGRRDFVASLSKQVRMEAGLRIGGVTVEVWSDSVLVIGAQLGEVIRCASLFQLAMLHRGFLIRGGISVGQHVSLGRGVVVSQPLVDAVTLESPSGGAP